MKELTKINKASIAFTSAAVFLTVLSYFISKTQVFQNYNGIFIVGMILCSLAGIVLSTVSLFKKDENKIVSLACLLICLLIIGIVLFILFIFFLALSFF